MTDEVKVCESCGMPMKEAKEHGGDNISIPYWVYCTDVAGKLKSRQEVREGMIRFYMSQIGKPREEAEKFVDEQMKNLPA